MHRDRELQLRLPGVSLVLDGLQEILSSLFWGDSGCITLAPLTIAAMSESLR